ncbi:MULTISPECIES: DUF365 domain-containing protein [unclassified Methanoculleus]|mgnify:CR=1 FL=1|jgi:hypothetical protein|uniref:DUF365 domain-containing protein n=1 Tax=unclassified Methanoculleus TaxID=2619537 RepID=UPI0026005A7B|nr:DUF365 domain-containing protein [Methanoculleus sp. UBA377]MDD2472856.1 DUF365 domain-containing protein [Methanoculleus sp.]
MPEITGVTFPVPKHLMPRFFKDRKTVFIKPATVYKDLRSGMKLVFYQSHEDTGYVGEATIKRIVVNDDPLAFFDTFGDAVFLTKDETRAYLQKQERWQGVRVRKGETKKRAWMALELEDIREYDTVKKPERFVPVGGRYLRE